MSCSPRLATTLDLIEPSWGFVYIESACGAGGGAGADGRGGRGGAEER